MEKNKHIEIALEKFAKNSQTELAKMIGGKCRQGHVHQWLYNLKVPSPENSLELERVTGGMVKARDFHPKIFGNVAT
jgi:DNA-binding transcriptional regulator YdaS (Cro superfamily)